MADMQRLKESLEDIRRFFHLAVEPRPVARTPIPVPYDIIGTIIVEDVDGDPRRGDHTLAGDPNIPLIEELVAKRDFREKWKTAKYNPALKRAIAGMLLDENPEWTAEDLASALDVNLQIGEYWIEKRLRQRLSAPEALHARQRLLESRLVGTDSVPIHSDE